MKYYSRSPEEWEEYDKEKNFVRDAQKRKMNMTKRYTYYLLAFLSVLSIFFIVFSNKIFRQNLSYAIESDGISINLMSDVSYTYPDLIDAKLYIQNNGKNTAKVNIKDFYFTVTETETNKTVFEKDYSSETNDIDVELERFQQRLIYKLSNEVKLDDLEPGTYRVRANFYMNGKNIDVYRDIKYVRDIKINMYSDQDFYLYGEVPKITLSLINYLPESVEKELSGVITVKQNDKEIYSQNFNFGKIKIVPDSGESYEIAVNKKLNAGDYYVFAEFNEMDFKIAAKLNVVDKIERNNDNISISSFFLPKNELNQNLYFDGYIKNNNKDNKAITVDKSGIIITYDEEEIYNYFMGDPVRYYLYGFSQTKVIDLEKLKTIKLDKIGKYKIEYYIYINEQELKEIYFTEVK
ncbi:MAG: hypothetical protein H7A31_01065 [Thermotogae bacterium]|nr:hypothetical protein [Thermotogota bacterium]HOO74124.1 hypothetical protein [Tepiditoga sp.]